MKIYTKTGDRGETSLFGGKRVQKNHKRIEAYGTIDELNSVLGLVISENISDKVKNILLEIQNKLFVLGGELATPNNVKSNAIINIDLEDIKYIEICIDDIDEVLEPLKSFILPGGCKSASLLHFARTVCRRAERLIIDIEDGINENIIKFVNRLSDLLFILARYENKVNNTPETKWTSRG